MDITPKHNSLHYPLNSEGDDIEKELLKPFTYLTSIPGKKIRHNLIDVLGFWIPVAEDKVGIIKDLAHYIHNGSLLIDDIQDRSDLRRGVPTAHKVYGIPRTLHGVSYIQSRIYDLLDQLHDTEFNKTYLKTIRDIFAGQGMEIYWRDTYTCPNEEDYLQMIYRKTSLGFIIVQNMMNTFSTSKKLEASKFLSTLGMYFQINDDYQDLQDQFYHDSKGFCSDITEGKFSYPMVHAINNFPKEGQRIIKILRKRTYDVNLKRECLVILEKCGSFEHTRKVLKELKSIVYAEIDKLDKNPLIDEFIEKAMAACL